MKCFGCSAEFCEGESYFLYENNAYCEDCFEDILREIAEDLKAEAENVV